MSYKEFLVAFSSQVEIVPIGDEGGEDLNSSFKDMTFEACDLLDRHTLAACEDLSIDDKHELEKIVRLGNVQFTKALIYAYRNGTYLQCAAVGSEDYLGVLNYLNNDCINDSKFRVLLEQKRLVI